MILSRIIKFLYIQYLKVKTILYIPNKKNSNIPISVFIPVLKKDLDILPYTIYNLRKNMENIDEIIIVSPKNSEVIDFCKKNNLSFFDENTMLPITKNEMNYGKRNGWLFQQLLKLFSDTVCKNEFILIWDSDTILLNKLELFDSKGRQIFYASNEYHNEYFVFFNKVFNTNIQPLSSFIVHSMLFSKTNLQNLRSTLENKYHIPWYSVIVNNCNKSNNSCFSEYETYANFTQKILKQKTKILFWSNIAIIRESCDIADAINKMKHTHTTLSFHSYLK